MKVNELGPTDLSLLICSHLDDVKDAIEDDPGCCPKEEIGELITILNAAYSDDRAVPMLKVTVE